MFAKVLGQARHVIKDGAVPKGQVQPAKEKEAKPVKPKPVQSKPAKPTKTTKDTPPTQPITHEMPAPISAEVARQAQLEQARKNMQNVPQVASQVHLMQGGQSASEVQMQQLAEQMAAESAAAVADIKAAATEALTQMSIFDLTIFNLPLNNYSSFDQAPFLLSFPFFKSEIRPFFKILRSF